MSAEELQPIDMQSVGVQATDPPPSAPQATNPMKRPLMRIFDLGSSLVVVLIFVTLGVLQTWDRAWELIVPIVMLFVGLQGIVAALITANYFGDGRRGIMMIVGVLAIVVSIAGFYRYW